MMQFSKRQAMKVKLPIYNPKSVNYIFIENCRKRVIKKLAKWHPSDKKYL